MSRAKKIIEDLETEFQLKINDSMGKSCPLKLSFSTGVPVENEKKLQSKVIAMLAEEKVELKSFYSDDTGFYIEVDTEDLKEARHKATKAIENKLRSSIREEDLEDDNVES